MVFKKIKKFFEQMYIRHMLKKAEKLFGDSGTDMIDYRPEKKDEDFKISEKKEQ